jgi:hypothetical protein
MSFHTSLGEIGIIVPLFTDYLLLLSIECRRCKFRNRMCYHPFVFSI